MDGTKTTGPRANIAKDHESGSLLAVTFHPIGTFCIVAHRFQSQLIEQTLRHVVGIAGGNGPFQPAWKPA